MEPFVSQDWLSDHLGDPDVRAVDCRFALGDPEAGRRLYTERHIADAAFLDLETELSGPVGDGRSGRHPLPSAEAFTAAARRAGISADSTVVAYDDGTGGAARLWWLLRHFGHLRAVVLDGGFSAWTGPTGSGEEAVEPGDFVARPRNDDVVDLDDVAALLRHPQRTLIDARAPERYRGEVEPIDPVPGHIPGAVNAPFTGTVPAEVVGAESELVVYCGSGVTACVVLLDLVARGRDDAKLYAGSYSEWVNRGLPVEVVDKAGPARGG